MGVTVGSLLDSMTASELAEWEAYERVSGPLDRIWEQETLASIHELLQHGNHLHGAAHFTDKSHTKNPVPEPQRWPRPHDALDPVTPDDEDEEE